MQRTLRSAPPGAIYPRTTPSLSLRPSGISPRADTARGEQPGRGAGRYRGGVIRGRRGRRIGWSVAPGVPGPYPARAGGPWLCRTLVLFLFHALVVPSIDDQGPAPPVNHDLMVERTQQDAVRHGRLPAVGLVRGVVDLAGADGLGAAAGPLAVPVPQQDRVADPRRDRLGVPDIQRQARPAQPHPQLPAP